MPRGDQSIQTFQGCPQLKVYFYPHAYLRDRQIDTIRRWPQEEAVNPEIAEERHGAQVSAKQAISGRINTSWKQRLPLLNLKRRPPGLSDDTAVYIWGGIPLTGRFILDLDNPWALVGYNLRAMPLYRHLLKSILLSPRCVAIRCLSEACRSSLKHLFGQAIHDKAEVHYPCIPQVVTRIEASDIDACHFLFVGTQFEIKGGQALLQAFLRLYRRHPQARLTLITHLPAAILPQVRSCPGIDHHPATFTRSEIHSRFMSHADVLVLPTYVESFGMVALEALAHGLALIATDVYALREMVVDGYNGNLLCPPISVWQGFSPSEAYYDIANIRQRIGMTDMAAFEDSLEKALVRFASDKNWRLNARRASSQIMAERFQC